MKRQIRAIIALMNSRPDLIERETAICFVLIIKYIKAPSEIPNVISINVEISIAVLSESSPQHVEEATILLTIFCFISLFSSLSVTSLGGSIL